MKKLTEAEWKMIKFSLYFLHDRDLSFWDNEKISLLEKTMDDLNMKFTPQSERKRKITSFIMLYQNKRKEISIYTRGLKKSIDEIDKQIHDFLKENYLLNKNTGILINKNTYDKLSIGRAMFPYTNILCGCYVMIEERCNDGELRFIEGRFVDTE